MVYIVLSLHALITPIIEPFYFVFTPITLIFELQKTSQHHINKHKGNTYFEIKRYLRWVTTLTSEGVTQLLFLRTSLIFLHISIS